MNKFAAALVLILTILPCAPAAQERGPRSRAAGPARRARAHRPAPRVVCVDPGHPSEVASGTNEQNGTNETRVAWEVALRLRAELRRRGFRVVMTKSAEGELVTNRDRALVANRSGAALMVRLHCDASVERGFAVYYPDRQGQARDGTLGPGPQVIEGSRRAAAAVHAGMVKGLRGLLNDNGIRTDYQTKVGSEQGALTGSVFSEVPVLTVEMVVLSDPLDAEFIKSERGQRRMAASIADGVARFLARRPLRGRPAGGARKRRALKGE